MAIGDHEFWSTLDALCHSEYGHERREAWERMARRGIMPSALEEVVAGIQRCCWSVYGAVDDGELHAYRKLLNDAWRSINEPGQNSDRPEVLEFLERSYYRSVFPLEKDDEECIRTAVECHQALAGSIAAAQAAAAACLAVRDGGSDLADWTRTAVEAWNGTSVAAGPIENSWADGIEPVEILIRSFDQLRQQTDCPIAPALDTALQALGKERSATSRKIPVLGFHETKVASVVSLQVDLVEKGTGAFYRDPVGMAFQPVTHRFLEGIDLAMAAALTDAQAALRFTKDVDLRWSVTGQELVHLDGASLAAGMAVALVQSLRDEPLDVTCAITAEIDEHGSLAPVAHVHEKVAEALKKGVLRVIVHPHNGDEARRAARERNRNPDEVVQAAETLDEACEKSSGLITGLCAYFDHLIARPDREEQLPIYMGGRTRTELYVEPDVRKRVVKPRLDERGEWNSGKERRAIERLATEARDIGETSLYGERDEESARRVPWRGEWEPQLNSKSSWRAMVLGPPGQGKSLLDEMTVRQIADYAKSALLNHQRRLDNVPLPIMLRLNDLVQATVQNKGNVQKAILLLLEQRSGIRADVAKYLADHAADDRVWLVLDALDEVEQREQLAPLLQVIGSWECRVLITSRPYGYNGARMPFEVSVYRLAPFNDLQVRQFVDRWGHRLERAEQDRLRRQLQIPAVRQVCQSPFLLTLVCWVAQRHELGRDLTRTQLYDRMLRDVLGLPLDGSAVVDETRAEDWLPLLMQIAWTWFLNSAGRRPLTYAQIIATMTANDADLPAVLGLSAKATAKLKPRQQAKFLLDELQKKRLLIPANAEKSAYVVPHRSVLEFLAGRALAQFLDGQWEWQTRLAPDRWTFVDKKAWHPDWREPIVFLSGRLRDAGPLLKLLGDRARDDKFRHRLALAGQCLGEINEATWVAHRTMINALALKAVGIWWNSILDHTAQVLEHYTSAIPALMTRCQIDLDRMPVLARLAELLADRNANAQRAAAEALQDIGPAAATDENLAHLPRLLADRDPYVRSAAAGVLGRIGAATDDILAQLGRLLTDQDWQVRSAAAHAVGGIGAPAATDDVLAQLAGLLADPDEGVRSAAAHTLGRIGAPAATEQFLVQMTQLLADPDERVRRAAAHAVGRIGLAAAKDPEILADLAQLLDDPDSAVRCAAASAVGGIGAPVATEQIRTQLAQLLADPDERVRKAAAHAAGRIGAPAATKQFLTQLAPMLADPAEPVRRAAAHAVGRIGAPAATEQFLTQLARLLAGPDKWVRRAAADAVGRIGAPAATEVFLAELARLLADPDAGVRRAAADAVGGIGAAAANDPEILAQLARLLADRNPNVRSAVADALGCIGVPATTEWFLAQLARLLADRYSNVRLAAASALGRIGAREATKAILVQLARLLADRNSDLRSAAAGALGRIGAREPTEVILAQLARLLADPHGGVRSAAADAVGRIGSAAVKDPEILTQLARLLTDPDSVVRWAVARAVGRIGSAAVKDPEILAQLARLLADRNSDLRSAAAEAVGRIGSAVAKAPAILAQLAQLLADSNWEVRSAAADAVGSIGAPAATAQFLAHLARLLANRNSDVRSAAAEAAGRIGSAVAKDPEILAQLAVLLADPGWEVRSAAADTVKHLHDAGIRLFATRRVFARTIVARTVDELSAS